MPYPNPQLAERRRFAIRDLIAIIAGFALAAALLPIFWGNGSGLGHLDAALMLLIYGWLGLCMSGPLVLLLERRRRPAFRRPTPSRSPPGRLAEVGEGPRAIPSRYTRFERAWLAMGGYWLVVTALLLPNVTHDDLLRIFLPILFLIALACLSAVLPRRQPPADADQAWTHRLAGVLLATWPLVWAVSIYLAIGISR